MSTVDRFEAMGTWIEARTGSGVDAQPVRLLFDAVEDMCSRFKASSELSRLNRAPGNTFEVSPDLAAVLSAAGDLRDRTDGLVDAAVGARVIDWGYGPTFADVAEVVPFPTQSWEGASWRLEDHTIHRDPGIRFDLGGIAKGWTADRAVESGLADVVSAGGDVRSRDAATTVDVVDPWGETAVRLALGVGGLATSSISRRRWMSANGPVHHIIDPRTGDPAVTPTLSATVISATAAEAEAGAKAVLILGAAGLAWAARQAWIRSAVVVWNDGNVYATPGVEVAA